MDNNRIEDFFNKSLEGFNDTPSDDVWGNINNQLNEETPFYKKSFFIIGVIGILFLSLVGGLIYQMNTKMEALSTKNQELSSEIIVLKEQNDNQQKRLAICQNNIIIEKEQQSKATRSFFNELSSNSNFSRKGMASTDFSMIKNDIGKNELSVSPSKNKGSQTESGNLSTNKKSDKEVKKQDSKKTIASKKSNQSEDNTLKETYLQGIRPYYSRNTPIKLENLYFPSKTISNRRNRIEIGFFTVKTDWLIPNGVDNFLDFGQSLQFKRNYDISNKLALIGGIGYSNYTYNSKITSANLLSIADFPSLNERLGAIEQVTVKNEFLTGTLGFQYRLAKRRNFSPFIKSSAIWKLYLPQTFEYQLSIGETDIYTDNRYFAYFGAVDVSLGFEKIFNHSFNYQLEVFAEKSLIPLGIENVSLTHFGLKTTFLF